MRIRNMLLPNPSEPPLAAHLPLHKGGFDAAAPDYSFFLMILPLTVLGRLSLNSTIRGYL